MFISLAGLVKYTEPRSNTDSCCSAGELAHKGAMLPFFFLEKFHPVNGGSPCYFLFLFQYQVVAGLFFKGLYGGHVG